MNWEFGTDIYIPPCVKQIASGNLLYSARSSARCSVMTQGVGRGVQEEAQEGGDMCICVVGLLCCATETNTTFKAMILQQIIQDSKCDINANGTLMKVKKHPYFQKKGFLYQKFKEILTCFLADNLSAIQSILNFFFFGSLFRSLYALQVSNTSNLFVGKTGHDVLYIDLSVYILNTPLLTGYLFLET